MSKIDKIIIDLSVLESLNISFDHYVSLIKLYVFHELPHNVDELIDAGYVKNIGSRYIITANLRRNIYEHLLHQGSPVKEKGEEEIVRETIVDRIDEYRTKWKEATHGRKPGIMGSRQSCLDKMTQWMKENPNYTFDQILKAADLYLSSVDNIKYIQRADYFISKKDSGIITSRLSAYIDEIEDIDTVDTNWTNELL